MNLLTTHAASFVCAHPGYGRVAPECPATFVRIQGAPVHLEPEPEARPISGCKHPASTNSKPCTGSLKAQQGYSELLRVTGARVCLAHWRAVTDSVPPSYCFVLDAGQDFVRSP